MELFEALEAALGQLPIIAEDLGELFPSVRELLADSTFPGHEGAAVCLQRRG